MRLKHNRAYIFYRFGSNFALMIIEVMRSVQVLLDDVISKLKAADESIKIEKSQYKCRYLLSTLVALVHSCSYVCQHKDTLTDTSKTSKLKEESTDDFPGDYECNTFPRQPFNIKYYALNRHRRWSIQIAN